MLVKSPIFRWVPWVPQDPDPSPAEFRLTLVWSSAFQFFAVPIGSGAKIIAGKGVFRETPEREHDVARVGFEVSLTLGIVDVVVHIFCNMGIDTIFIFHFLVVTIIVFILAYCSFCVLIRAFVCI